MAYTVAIVIMGPNANDKESICVWVYIAVCFTCNCAFNQAAVSLRMMRITMIVVPVTLSVVNDQQIKPSTLQYDTEQHITV